MPDLVEALKHKVPVETLSQMGQGTPEQLKQWAQNHTTDPLAERLSSEDIVILSGLSRSNVPLARRTASKMSKHSMFLNQLRSKGIVFLEALL